MSVRDPSPDVDFRMLDDDEFLDLCEDGAAPGEHDGAIGLPPHGLAGRRRRRASGRSHLFSALAAAAAVGAALAVRSLLSSEAAPVAPRVVRPPLTAPSTRTAHAPSAGTPVRRHASQAQDHGRRARSDVQLRHPAAGNGRAPAGSESVGSEPPAPTASAIAHAAGSDFGFER
jgi:hypothetical protein